MAGDRTHSFKWTARRDWHWVLTEGGEAHVLRLPRSKWYVYLPDDREACPWLLAESSAGLPRWWYTRQGAMSWAERRILEKGGTKTT